MYLFYEYVPLRYYNYVGCRVSHISHTSSMSNYGTLSLNFSSHTVKNAIKIKIEIKYF